MEQLAYPASLKKWCETAVDKKTGEPKREIKEVRVQTDENREPASVEIEVRPLSPIARKRGDAGAVYMVKKAPQPDKIDVTVKNPEASHYFLPPALPSLRRMVSVVYLMPLPL